MPVLAHSTNCDKQLAVGADRDSAFRSGWAPKLSRFRKDRKSRAILRLCASGAVSNSEFVQSLSFWPLTALNFQLEHFLGASVVLLVLVTTTYACSPLPHRPDLDQMLASAKTASDHEEIAKEYDKEAAEAQAEYERHQSGANLYAKATARQHCASLADDYQRAQQEASVLAAYHRKLAEEMKSGGAASPAPAPTVSP